MYCCSLAYFEEQSWRKAKSALEVAEASQAPEWLIERLEWAEWGSYRSMIKYHRCGAERRADRRIEGLVAAHSAEWAAQAAAWYASLDARDASERAAERAAAELEALQDSLSGVRCR